MAKVIRVGHDLPTKLPPQTGTDLFASSSLLRIPLPELDSLPPKPLLIRALPLGSNQRELTPRNLMPECLHIDRELEDRCFPFGMGTVCA